MTRPSSASSLIIFRDVDQSDTAAAPMLPVDYALERMRAEEAAAERSASGAAHDVHQQLARLYAAIVLEGQVEAVTGGTGK